MLFPTRWLWLFAVLVESSGLENRLKSQILALQTKNSALEVKYNLLSDKCPQHAPKASTKCKDVCPSQAVDLIFVVDSSGSISAVDYQLQIEFLQNLVDMLDFNPIYHNATIMSVVQFSTWTKIEPELKRVDDPVHIKAALGRLKQIKGYTNLGWTMNLVNKKLMVPDVTLRKDAIPVIVIMTDGMSQDGIGNVMELHMKGALVISLGVGKEIDAEQLKSLATPGYFHEAIDYVDLGKYKQYLTKTICEKYEAKKQCEDKCQTKCDMVPAPETKECIGAAPLDVIFVVDSSKSINDADYASLKVFLEGAMNDFSNLNGDKTGNVLSLIQFSSTHKAVFSYQDDVRTILRGVRDMEQMKSGTNLKGVLSFVNKFWLKQKRTRAVFDRSGGSKAGVLRPGAKPIVVIITDAQDAGLDSSGTAKREIKRMHDLGVVTIALGIGEINHDVLQQLASPDTNNKFAQSYTSYDALVEKQRVFSGGLCVEGRKTVCKDECNAVCHYKVTEKIKGCEGRSPAEQCDDVCRDVCTKSAVCTGGEPMDILFIIDSSRSVEKNAPGAFDELKEFLKNAVGQFEALKGDKSGTVMSMIQFSTSHEAVFRFDDNEDDMIAYIDGMRHLAEGTNIYSVLDFVNANWLKSVNDKSHPFGILRKGAQAIVVIITDAKDNDGKDDRPLAYQVIKEMHDRDIITMAIGVGDVNPAHLEELASHDEKIKGKFVHHEPSYHALAKWQKRFTEKVCVDGEVAVCTRECKQVCH